MPGGRFTFFWLGTIPINETNVRGILLNARDMALKMDPSINKILIKGAAHESSARTSTGEIIKYPLHYTYNFKNEALDKANKHWTAHANIKGDPKDPENWYITDLAPRREQDGKTLRVDPDEYDDFKKGRKWNKWDPSLNEIKKFSEADIAGWYLGDKFIAYPSEGENSKQFAKISDKELADLKADQEKSKKDTEATILKGAK